MNTTHMALDISSIANNHVSFASTLGANFSEDETLVIVAEQYLEYLRNIDLWSIRDSVNPQWDSEIVDPVDNVIVGFDSREHDRFSDVVKEHNRNVMKGE